MEGSFQTIQLLAGIDDGNCFLPSQYLYMSILVHIEDHIVDLVDSYNLSKGGEGHVKASNFTIHGRHLGATTLFVSVRQQSGYQISSQHIKVEVYASPVVHPPDIFLVPGASYVLTVKGGPTVGVIVEYASTDDGTVAVESSTGQVSAVSPGNTTIVATLYGKQQKIICQTLGIVRVGVPYSIMLIAQSRKLAVGRDLPIFPFLPEGDLFSFYGQCKNYQWSIEDGKILGFRTAELPDGNQNDLLRSSKNDQSSAYTDQKDFDSVQLLYGRSAGRTQVNLSFSCDFISVSFSLSRSYNASMPIWVVSEPPLALGIPITWILPPYYTTSDLLPLSLEVYNKLNTQTQKSVITYSVLGHRGITSQEVSRDPISIEGKRIKTTDSNNLACIQTTDHTTGRIEVASCIKVAEVSQVRISTKLASHTIDLAVSAEVALPIEYFDDLGNPFHEARDVALVDCDTNFRDIVTVSFSPFGDGNIKIKAVHKGRALVRVKFTENPLMADYVMISVGSHIYPQNPVVQPGACFNFSIEVSGRDEQSPGKWLSANESVISVDSSGAAVAIGEGTSLGIGCGMGCKIVFGYTKPWTDLDTGDSYCLFFPYSPEHLANGVPKLKGMRQDISISIHAFLKDTDDVSGSTSALFIGGFSILEMGKVNFTRHSNRSIITIVGNTDVRIHWHDRDQLTVRLVSKEGYGISGFAQYEVKVLGGKLVKDKIVFELPSNGQRQEVDVNYDPGERDLTIWVGLVCLGLLLLTVVFFIRYLERLDRSQPPIHFATPSRFAPAAPAHSSPSMVNEQSPQTPPQPFIDYVRRTIDETPYYRKERRFDPQNTY
ncbi:hypothetical protein Dimus_013676 [Dionaea muscipula]